MTGEPNEKDSREYISNYPNTFGVKRGAKTRSNRSQLEYKEGLSAPA